MMGKVWSQLSRRCPPPLRRFGHEERGANMVIFAIGLMVMMGMGGLAVDGSNAYHQQQRMQIAADAAALGGARALANARGTVAVDAAIRQLAQTNGAETVTWSYINDGRGVHVNAARDVPTYFARLLGIAGIPVGGASEAQYETVTATDNLFPMTFSCNCIEGGESTFVDPPPEDDVIGGGCPLMPIALHESTIDGQSPGAHLENIFNGTQPGNFGWLSWTDQTSATSLHESLVVPGTSDQYINPQIGEPGIVVTGVDVSGLTGIDNSSSVRAGPGHPQDDGHPGTRVGHDGRFRGKHVLSHQ